MVSQKIVDDLNEKAISSIEEIIKSDLSPQSKIAAIHYLAGKAYEYTEGVLRFMDTATSWQVESYETPFPTNGRSYETSNT